ncbi:MAG: hypothetical protein ACRENA_17350 [Vulcanimicrobiaceae bacterium]
MKKLIWTIVLAFGLASLPFGGAAFAGQGWHGHKAVAHAGKSGKHHGKKHHAKHAGNHHKNK